jgi:hypothetical protein
MACRWTENDFQSIKSILESDGQRLVTIETISAKELYSVSDLGYPTGSISS